MAQAMALTDQNAMIGVRIPVSRFDSSWAHTLQVYSILRRQSIIKVASRIGYKYRRVYAFGVLIGGLP